MIWLDNSNETIRVQGKNKHYLKLNDGKDKFKWFYNPVEFSGFICGGPTSLVEWQDE